MFDRILNTPLRCKELVSQLPLITSGLNFIFQGMKPMHGHCVKYHSFTQFPGLKILWRGTVSADFRAIHLKLCLFTKFPHQEMK